MSQNAMDIYNQGYYYYTGSEGHPLNRRKAFECFNEAAALGHSDAMNYLGLIYEAGQVVEKDMNTAASWFYRAAEANPQNPFPQYNMARMFYEGTGAPYDKQRAFELCEKVIKLCIGGDGQSPYPEACFLAGCILIEHYNNLKESYQYFVDAAKYGDIAKAWYNLGWLSEKGVVPLKKPGDNAQAARDGMACDFYAKAAEKGMAEAMDAMGRLYIKYNMTDKARFYLQKAASLGYEPAQKRLKMLDLGEGRSSIWSLFKK